MRTLIGIHGLDNKPSRRRLVRGWEAAIREGLAGAGQDRPLPLTISYWADLYYSSALYPEQEPYTRRPVRAEPFPSAPLCSENLAIRELSQEAVAERYPDLVRYYLEPGQGERTRLRLRRLLERYRGHRLLLLCHSMGCLIAFDVLHEPAFRDLDCEMASFGCPLGFPQLAARMEEDHGPLRIPAPIHTWFNYADLRDPVATTGLNEIIRAGPSCPNIQDRLVENDYRSPAGEWNPHKIYGYLRSVSFAGQILGFLDPDRP